mgnify:CR=1 FL=1
MVDIIAHAFLILGLICGAIGSFCFIKAVENREKESQLPSAKAGSLLAG